MMEPIRIRLSRKKGFRLAPGTVSVARPTGFGNPFTIAGCRDAGYTGTDAALRARCVDAFRVWIDTPSWRMNWDGDESERVRASMLAALPTLLGKNLACWCPLDQPCHADVLMEIANR